MNKQLTELLQQMLETEMGGVKIYETAVQCAVNPDLKKEWTEYLQQTRRHVEVVQELFGKLGLEPEMTPGRKVVGHIGESLVKAMTMAKAAGDAKGAELVACECVVFAETKDHLNWELLGKAAEKAKGEEKKMLRDHPLGTDYAAHVMHKSNADRNMHEEMGFHDGWGTVLAQLAKLVEKPA